MNSVRSDGRKGCRPRLHSGWRCVLVAIVFCMGSEQAFAQCEEQQKLTASDAGLVDNFGSSVSVSGDTALIGAGFDGCLTAPFCGSVYVFRFNGTDWLEEQKLTPPDAPVRGVFGQILSVSGDTALVGTFFGNGNCVVGSRCGSAYVFYFNGSSWVEGQKLTASDARADDFFGVSVSVSGDTALVGASGPDCTAGTRCGAAYVFRFNGTSWVEEQKLTASDAAESDHFGGSVSVSGDTVVVGAPGRDCGSRTDCGAAYVFHFDGTSWVEEQKLTASDAAGSDKFGRYVSFSGGTALVLAGGSVYVFRFNGTSWVEEQKLTASDAASGEGFGQSISVSGDTFVVGARGFAFVFRFNGSSWIEGKKLIASDSDTNDRFGFSVSVSGNAAMVGAFGDDCPAGFSCGSAYVFDLSPSCGNCNVDLEEACDGGLGCTDCLCDTGFESTVPPSLDCQPICGNGNLDPGEECDGGLSCTDCSCDSGFEPAVPPSLDCQPICGNGDLVSGEECDGGLGCTDCSCDSGFEPTIPPSLDCQPICGNGVLNSAEECDGLNDAACPGLCQNDCTCGPFCGDGTCDPGEDLCFCSADCGMPASSELLDSTCADGLDNDCDGLIDADDPDCAAPTVPTITQWGMIFLALLLLATGKIVFRRTAYSSGSA